MQRINGEESKLQARQVDVTANSQRLSNPLYVGIKTWRTMTHRYTHIEHNKQKANTLCAKRRKHINNLENSYNSSYLRILKCLEKQSLFCSYCFVNTSDCISSIQNLIQLFVIVKISLFQLWLSKGSLFQLWLSKGSLFQLWLSKGSLLELSLSIEVSFLCDWA